MVRAVWPGAVGVPARNGDSALAMDMMASKSMFGGLSRIFMWQMGKGFLG